MKNQFFGDNRDLFKYDLVYRIMEAGLVNHFTYIPMLTKGQGDACDRKEENLGNKNDPLREFLDECIRKYVRNINQLEEFFKDKITIYKKDDEDKYFSRGQREQYFEQVPDKLLKKSLILVDPDNGLEPRKGAKKEHVQCSDIKKLYERMDENSILMVFQDLSRKKREYLNQTSTRIKKEVRTEEKPIFAHDGKTAFFFLTQNKAAKNSLRNVILEYKNKNHYDKLQIS